MIDQNKPADPTVHETAMTAARRCLWVIAALLRDEERSDALTEFYLAIREEMERRPDAGGGSTPEMKGV